MAKDPYSLREIFQQMELDLIASLKRNFIRHKKEEEKEGFKWDQWQLAKLRNLVKFRKKNRDIIGRYSEPIEKAIDDVLQESFSVGENTISKLINKIKHVIQRNSNSAIAQFPFNAEPKSAIIKYLNKLFNLGAPQETNFFGMNEKKLQALQDSVKNDAKEAQSAVLRQMDDVYRQTIFKTHMYMQSGAVSLNKAIDMATKDFLDKGLNCIQYRNGNRVNIASYAEMALRTASQRATFLGEGKKRDEWGMHLVVVSAHANTCELCAPWQGKILIDDIFSHGTQADGSYPLLSEAMNKGLFHPNCRHTLITYFPGITKLPEVPDIDEALDTYKAEQEQRYAERQIRKWKRVEAGSCDAENVNKATDKVNEWQERLKQVLEENPELRRDYTKETAKSIIENTGNGGILNNKKWLKAKFSTQKRFDKHIEKHLGEYEGITPEEYLNMARDLLIAPLSEDIEGFVDKAGFIYKYRKSTNDFAVGRADGKISTIFKPDKGIIYWEEERSKNGL